MRSRGAVVDIGNFRNEETGNELGDVRRQGRRESPPGISGKVILVISGQLISKRRNMYQSLEPKAGGSNLFQEVKPHVTERTPHDTTAGQYRKNQLK